MSRYNILLQRRMAEVELSRRGWVDIPPTPRQKNLQKKPFLQGMSGYYPPHPKKIKNLQKKPLLQGMGGGYLDGVLAGAMRGISNH